MTGPRAVRRLRLDLDGTVYLGDELLPGAAETIRALARARARASCSSPTSRWRPPRSTRRSSPRSASPPSRARRRHRGRRARPLPARAPSGRRAAADRRGRRRRAPERGGVRRDRRARARRRGRGLVRSSVRLRQAARRRIRAVRENGATIVATNPDPYCPTPDGGLPDCAAMLAASRRAPAPAPRRWSASRAVTWRPRCSSRLDVEPAECAGRRGPADDRRGDGPERSVPPGILVLSGATSADVVADAETQPDYVLDGIHELLPLDRRKDRASDRIHLHADPQRRDRRRRARGARPRCGTRGLRYVGFKDIGQPPEVLRESTEAAHERGMEVMLEVVSISRRGRAALAARRRSTSASTGCSAGPTPTRARAILAGTDDPLLPVSRVSSTGHPSVLPGDIDDDRRRTPRG